MSAPGTGPTAPFAFLADYPPRVIATCIKSETDNMAGLVLAQAPPALAAKIMANLTAEHQRRLMPAIRQARDLPRERLARLVPAIRAKLDAANAPGTVAHAPGAPSPPAGKAGSGRKDRDNPSANRTADRKGLRSWRPRRDNDAQAVNAPPPAAQGATGKQEALRRALALTRNQAARIGRPRPGRGRSPAPAPGGHGRVRLDGPAIAAEILRHAPPEVRRNLREQEPRLYQALRRRMFAFEDLAESPRQALAAIFTLAGAKAAALALRFASPKLVQRALEAVSDRRRALLSEEMDFASERRQRVRIRDVEEAQQQILKLALALQQAGRIIIDPQDPDLAD